MADNTDKPITKDTAWATREHGIFPEETDISQTASFSLLQPGKKPTRLEGSFALIADGEGDVKCWPKKKPAGDSVRSTSDTHHPEESGRET